MLPDFCSDATAIGHAAFADLPVAFMRLTALSNNPGITYTPQSRVHSYPMLSTYPYQLSYQRRTKTKPRTPRPTNGTVRRPRVRSLHRCRVAPPHLLMPGTAPAQQLLDTVRLNK